MSLNSVEKGWAIGFFDGEGSISWAWSRKKNKYPRLQMGNACLQSLRRFRRVVGTGYIWGPYDRGVSPVTGKPYKLRYEYGVYGQDAYTVAKVLYPYLSPRRKKRMREVFGASVFKWSNSG